MTMTTGAILRRITEANLSASAHKLATIILDGIAWKDGYNGLGLGTAAFTLSELAARMDMSRQHLTALLSALSRSDLGLVRWKPNGKFAPWLFRFGAASDDLSEPDDVSASGDTSLSIDSNNKMIFSGRIEIGAEPDVHRTRWAALIRSARSALACRDVDVQTIWERFLAFNQARGNVVVPAGYLLGFMRRWRTAPRKTHQETVGARPMPDPTAQDHELRRLIAAAPCKNRHFHASDLCRAIGKEAYDARVLDMIRRFSCARFTATLAVHGQAVCAGEIGR